MNWIVEVSLYTGFFGEVFRGMWNGTDVAIKIFLEQDLTAENMEDFCNEISILRYYLPSNARNWLILFKVCPLTFMFPVCSRLRHPNGINLHWEKWFFHLRKSLHDWQFLWLHLVIISITSSRKDKNYL